MPRARDWEMVSGIVEAVRTAIGDRPLHVFGLGKPETTTELFRIGVDSVDSSAYVKLAADGRSWADPEKQVDNPSMPELLNLALENLSTATRARVPLSRRAVDWQRSFPF